MSKTYCQNKFPVQNCNHHLGMMYMVQFLQTLLKKRVPVGAGELFKSTPVQAAVACTPRCMLLFSSSRTAFSIVRNVTLFWKLVAQRAKETNSIAGSAQSL